MHFTTLKAAISVKNLRIRPGKHYNIMAENLPFLKKLLMLLEMKTAYVYGSLTDNMDLYYLISRKEDSESVQKNN